MPASSKCKIIDSVVVVICSGRHNGREPRAPGSARAQQQPDAPDLSTTSLTCRLSSLDHLLIRLPALSASVLSR